MAVRSREAAAWLGHLEKWKSLDAKVKGAEKKSVPVSKPAHAPKHAQLTNPSVVEPPYIPGSSTKITNTKGEPTMNGKTMPVWLILVLALAALLINQSFWQWRDHVKQEYNNTPAGMAEIELERMKLQRKLIEADAERSATAGSPAPSVRPVQVAATLPARQNHEQGVSANMRDMIGHCGKNTQELVYKPDSGCFFFDNLSGSSEKSIGLWSRNEVQSIIGAFDDKPNITITGPDGSRCESGPADRCEHWSRQFPADSDGFRKFKVRVPPGQGLIANLRTY